MSPEALAVLGVLAVIGLLAVLRSGRSSLRRATFGARRVSRAGGHALRVLLLAVVITAIQWAVLAQVEAVGAWVAVLGVPALLAALSLARLLTATEVVHTDDHRGNGRSHR